MLVGYMRVPSDNDRQTADLQRNALLAAGVAPRHLFADKASGARDDRPGLQQALDYVRPSACLVGWTLDRLGRLLSPLFRIITTLQAQGVALRSRTEQMDTTTPQGAFLLRVFGALAPYERASTQERMRGRAGGRTTPRETREDGLRRSAPKNERPSSPPGMREPAQSPSAGRSGVKRTTLSDALARAAAQTVPLIKGGA